MLEVENRIALLCTLLYDVTLLVEVLAIASRSIDDSLAMLLSALAPEDYLLKVSVLNLLHCIEVLIGICRNLKTT